jgi:hypothetical protein
VSLTCLDVDKFKCESKVKTMEELGGEARSLARNTFGGRMACWSSGMGLGRVSSTYSLTQTCTKPNNKLVSALLEHFWCYDKPRTTSNSQDSPLPGLGGSHHLPPYSIFFASPQGPHPNGILSQDSQMGVLKLPKLGLSRLWGPITLCADLRLRWGLKQSCSPHQELSNSISHATWTQRNRVNS